jgi:coproporphyrinogen III oxidase-like Fe-S oxidoreductase
MGAASNLDDARFTRPRTTDTYYDWVAAGCDWQTESISQNERLLETLMLRMRLREGVELRSIATEFGPVILDDLWQCIAKYQRDGWVEVLGRNRQIIVNVERLTEDNSLRLSDPDGLLFSNAVLSDIFAQFD